MCTEHGACVEDIAPVDLACDAFHDQVGGRRLAPVLHLEQIQVDRPATDDSQCCLVPARALARAYRRVGRARGPVPPSQRPATRVRSALIVASTFKMLSREREPGVNLP